MNVEYLLKVVAVCVLVFVVVVVYDHIKGMFSFGRAFGSFVVACFFALVAVFVGYPWF